MTAYTAESGIATLMQRERIAAFSIYAVILIYALTVVGELLELGGGVDINSPDPDPLTMAYLAVLLANFAAFIGSVIAVAMWIHRAHANLHEAGYEPLTFTPGWAVGWYFIPIANLFKPFQAMRELWTTSLGVSDSYSASAPGNLSLWWGFWIVGNILGNVSTRLSFMGDGSNLNVALALGIASSLCVIGSAWLLRGIIRSVTAAQDHGLSAVSVFE